MHKTFLEMQNYSVTSLLRMHGYLNQLAFYRATACTLAQLHPVHKLSPETREAPTWWSLLTACNSSWLYVLYIKRVAKTQHLQMLCKFFPLKEATGCYQKHLWLYTEWDSSCRTTKRHSSPPIQLRRPPSRGQDTRDFNKTKGGVPTLNSIEKQGPNLGEMTVLQSLVTSAMLHLPPCDSPLLCTALPIF